MLLMGKSTISLAIFNSYVGLPEGTSIIGAIEIDASYRFRFRENNEDKTDVISTFLVCFFHVFSNMLEVLVSTFSIWEINFKYPLVNCHITMENHHAINGKFHYFNGHFQ